MSSPSRVKRSAAATGDVVNDRTAPAVSSVKEIVTMLVASAVSSARLMRSSVLSITGTSLESIWKERVVHE